MELFLVIFQVFHDFQSLWEPYQSHLCSHELHPKIVSEYDREITQSQSTTNQQQNHPLRTDSSLSHWGATIHFTGTKSSP